MKKEGLKEGTLKIKSPTRIDLAGGFLDIWPVHALIKDSFVVNCSIPVFTSVHLSCSKPKERKSLDTTKVNKNPEDGKINVEVFSPAGLYKQSFLSWDQLLKERKPELNLLKKHIEYWGGNGFKYKTLGLEGKKSSWFNPKCQREWAIGLKSSAPVGGGLGASSSLCVSLAKAFASLFHLSFTKEELLFLCRDLETALLHVPAGIQDYIPALDPKPDFMYIIECSPFGPKWKKKTSPLEFFKEHLLLVDTRKSHHSGENNWENFKKVMEKDQKMLRGLNQLKDNALKAVEISEKENWSDLFSVLNREQSLRAELFSNWLNPHVKSVIDLVQSAGARALKLAGAGGGGSLIVLAKNRQNKKHIKEVCKKNHIPVVMS